MMPPSHCFVFTALAMLVLDAMAFVPMTSSRTSSAFNVHELRMRRTSSSLQTKQHPEDGDSVSDEITDPVTMPPLPTLSASVILPYVLFVSFWPLLALVRFKLDGSNPVEYFDIDRYMALQEMMQDTPGRSNEIMELPQLSPAEQMVGAIFGPPH